MRLRSAPQRPSRKPEDDFSHEAVTNPRFFLVRRLPPSLTRLWRSRLIVATILLEATLLLLIAARLTFWLPPVSRWLTGEARRAVAEKLAGAEIAGEMHVGWFGSVRLDDLRLSATPGSGVPTVSAQEVSVEPELGALIHGHLRVKTIELRWVRLHPGARGEAIRALLEKLQAKHDAAAPAKPAGPPGPKTEPPLVVVKDLYIDPPLENTAGTTTLGPLSFKTRWSREGSQLRWDISGGMLEGKAGRFAFAGQADRAAGTVHARAELDKLRIVELPPGWFQGFSAQPTDGEISGEINLERAADGALSGTAQAQTEGLSVSWPRLASTPVAPLNLGVQGNWRWDPAARTIAFHQGKIALNGGEVAIETTVTLGPPKKVEVELSVDGLDLQKTIDSLPTAFQPPPEAPRVEGSLKAVLSFGGPIGSLDDIEIHKADVDLSGLRESAKNDPAADFLRRPFRYTPRDDEGPHESFEVGPANVHFVSYASLPKYVPHAVTLSEDAGFFFHHGFDFDEIKDSIAKDISTGEAVRGGSTLTQQLVKNLFLSREKTLSRKIREALITLQVEATLPKQRILEIYLNTIEWGPEIYGIGQASQKYFGVPAYRLSPKEAAFLATMIPSPKRFFHMYVERGSLTRAWEERVDRVVGRLHAANVLDDAAYAQALAEPLVFHHGYRGEATERPSEAPPAAAPSKSLWQRLFGK